jgi:mannitol-1-phosphate/altronate dehydrogenase
MDLLNNGTAVNITALAIAGWTRYLMGADEQGHNIVLKEPMSTQLAPLVWQVNERERERESPSVRSTQGYRTQRVLHPVQRPSAAPPRPLCFTAS